MFDGITAIISINKIMKGKSAKLSKKQIMMVNINLIFAHKNLSDQEYQEVNTIYNKWIANKTKILINRGEYYKLCKEMISELETVAPYNKLNY